MRKKQITVFASGSGSNFKALHQSALKNEIPARITALVTDNADAGALAYARSHRIRNYLLSPSDFPDSESLTLRLEEILKIEAPDLITLAGYLKKIPQRIAGRYYGKIINIHPSLLPKYGGKGCYGMRVHRAVIDNGEKESGCTIHYVTKEYDKGPIIAQSRVPVNSDDTPESLAKKVQQQEHLLYPDVVRRLLSE